MKKREKFDTKCNLFMYMWENCDWNDRAARESYIIIMMMVINFQIHSHQFTFFFLFCCFSSSFPCHWFVLRQTNNNGPYKLHWKQNENVVFHLLFIILAAKISFSFEMPFMIHSTLKYQVLIPNTEHRTPITSQLLTERRKRKSF